jgi:RecA/RadA recombinase
MAKAKKAAAKKTATESTKGNALDRAIAQIEKQYGSGSIMKMDESKHRKIDGIPTGALSLQNNAGAACNRQCPKNRRRRSIYRC